MSLQQRPPDGGEVAEVTLDLLLQVECPDDRIKTKIRINIKINIRILISLLIFLCT